MASLEYLPKLITLPADERRDYVRALLDTLDDEPDQDEASVAKAWRKELERRVEEDDQTAYDYEHENVGQVFERVREAVGL